jgi:hypothetical protein
LFLEKALTISHMETHINSVRKLIEPRITSL